MKKFICLVLLSRSTIFNYEYIKEYKISYCKHKMIITDPSDSRITNLNLLKVYVVKYFYAIYCFVH